MMVSSVEVEKPGSVVLSMTISMTLDEWAKVAEHLKTVQWEYPTSELRQHIEDHQNKIRATLWKEEKP